MTELTKYAGNNRVNVQGATTGSIGFTLPGGVGELTSGEAYKVGAVPANALITRVTLVVTEGFTGTTPTFDIGDGVTADIFASDANVSAVTVVPGAINTFSDAPVDIVVTPTLSSCTAGDAKVVVEFVRTDAYTGTFTE